MKKLVAVLGPNALEDYCKNGCFGQAIIDKIRDVELFGN